MSCITKANAHDHALRVHLKLTSTKTLCGITLTPAQEDFAECNCGRCKRIAAKVQRNSRPRSIVRLNGRKVSVNQQPLIA